MAQRQTLPVLPLRGTGIFPGLTAPLAAGRPGTLRAIEAALKGDRLVFAVAQRDNTDEPTPEILYSMGVIARIGQIQRVADLMFDAGMLSSKLDVRELALQP